MLNWIHALPCGFSPHSYVVSFSSLKREGRSTHHAIRLTARKPTATPMQTRIAEWFTRTLVELIGFFSGTTARMLSKGPGGVNLLCGQCLSSAWDKVGGPIHGRTSFSVLCVMARPARPLLSARAGGGRTPH